MIFQKIEWPTGVKFEKVVEEYPDAGFKFVPQTGALNSSILQVNLTEGSTLLVKENGESMKFKKPQLEFLGDIIKYKDSNPPEGAGEPTDPPEGTNPE